MPAVANAVFDAVGVRVDEIPVTPEKILKALEAKAQGKPARYGPASFPDVAWPETLLVAPPWEGGDGTASNEAGRAKRATARRRRADARSAVRSMMRLPRFEYRAPRVAGRGGGDARASRRPTRCSWPAAPTCCRT